MSACFMDFDLSGVGYVPAFDSCLSWTAFNALKSRIDVSTCLRRDTGCLSYSVALRIHVHFQFPNPYFSYHATSHRDS